MIKRTVACLLLFSFIFALVPVVRAEELRVIHTSDALDVESMDTERSIDQLLAEMYLEEFGPDVVVEIGEDSNPVSVNGYPYQIVQASFNVRGVEDKFTGEIDWVDYPFWQPATQYNGNLANMSLIMALCYSVQGGVPVSSILTA